jgi:hypothetical protein
MLDGVASTKLSISLSSELLAQADHVLARPGEGRSALIARLLAQALRAAQEAELDAAYDRAFDKHPLGQVDLERTDAIARAAVRSTTASRGKRGPSV